jgi:hypothetical protein
MQLTASSAFHESLSLAHYRAAYDSMANMHTSALSDFLVVGPTDKS